MNCGKDDSLASMNWEKKRREREEACVLTGRCPSSCGAPAAAGGGRPWPARSGTPAPRSPSPAPPPPSTSSLLRLRSDQREPQREELLAWDGGVATNLTGNNNA